MTVAAVLIMRNEERSIARAVSSVHGVVDRVVVLDTGSEDRSIELARSNGADVYSFRWCDDFAAARNAALSIADADVNLVLDADEWLAEGGDWLCSERHTRWAPTVGVVRVRNIQDPDEVVGERVTLSERVLPRGVRYRGRVHEQPEHSLYSVETPIVLGHDGYQPAQRNRKAGRNAKLLRTDLAEAPGDPYLTYQLGKEHQAAREWGESAQLLTAALADAPAGAPWLHSLVVRTMSVLGAAGRYPDALAVARAHEQEWADSPDYWFAVGSVLMNLGAAKPELAAGVVPLVERAWLRCLAIGERPDLEGAVAGRGSWLAAHNLAGLYEASGDVAKAERYRQEFRRP